MRKIYSVLSLILLLVCFTQCAEEELFIDSTLASDLQLNAARTLDAKAPEITKVTANGSKVTIEFSNYTAPSRPEGGFELIVNGKRTSTSVTPRLYSADKNLKMTFSTGEPDSKYQIYARWNSGYLRSNEMGLSGGTQSSPSQADDDDDDEDSGSSGGGGSVSAPSNKKEPVISNLSFSGSKVTLEFVNFSAPSQPEGGFELMVDGKRTGTSIIPRLYSNKKDSKVTFSISNPGDHCYQIYARWNSGYIGSEAVCKAGQQSSGGSGGAPSDDSDDDSGDDDSGDDNNDDDGGNDSGVPSSLPDLKLVSKYEFNSNFGSNVNQSRDGLKVHHLGHNNGRIVKEGGVGAYHFKVTPGSYTKSDKTYRQELVPRNLPSPYFNEGFRAKWGQEYVFQIRLKISNDYEIGSDYNSFISMKNDYTVQREGSYTMHIEGDHFFLRHMYASKSGVGSSGAGRKVYHYSADGEKIESGKDYHATRRTGSGYKSIASDKGKWVTWTFYVKWSYGSDGFFQVYKNDRLFHSYRGATSYKDEDAPYFKFGLYNSWWKNGQRTGSTLQEMYVDYLRVYVPK
ncbi:MAG: heparin lyase I family protein [Cyclobacteriaceae bacterium]